MKLRLDLLKHLTAEDIAEAAVKSVHRYRPEPLFATTGVGYLRPATPEEEAEDMADADALILRLKARVAESEKTDAVSLTDPVSQIGM